MATTRFVRGAGALDARKTSMSRDAFNAPHPM